MFAENCVYFISEQHENITIKMFDTLQVLQKLKSLFRADFASEEDTFNTIRKVYDEAGTVRCLCLPVPWQIIPVYRDSHLVVAVVKSSSNNMCSIFSSSLYHFYCLFLTFVFQT